MNRTVLGSWVPLFLLLSAAACAQPPVVTFVNTYKAGTGQIEGTVTFAHELPAGTRVQVAMSDMPSPFLGASNGMKSVDLKAPSNKVAFVFSGLAEGPLSMQAIAYRPEVLENLRKAMLAADEEFKKTGKPTMLPPMGPDVGDQAGFFTGEAVASVDSAKAKKVDVKAGASLKGIDFTTLTLDKKP